MLIARQGVAEWAKQDPVGFGMYFNLFEYSVPTSEEEVVLSLVGGPLGKIGGKPLKGVNNLGKGKGNVSFTYDSKIAKQMNNRGWNDNLVQNTLQNPHRTQVTRDTRYRPDGTRNNDPATAYIREDGSYVVRNDRTGDIVQVSNRNDPNWVSPWD